MGVAESVRLDNLLGMKPTGTRYTYTVGTSYQFLPGRRTEGASFVVMCVLCVRCVVYVTGLGKIYMTLDRRALLLYVLLLLLLILIKKNN